VGGNLGCRHVNVDLGFNQNLSEVKARPTIFIALEPFKWGLVNGDQDEIIVLQHLLDVLS
jgi:hypothetical protein